MNYPPKSALQRLAPIILTVGAAWLTGCATLPPSAGPRADSQDLGLSAQNAVMAEALANYGMGVLREGQRDAGSVSNYLRVVELEPGLSAIYLRAAVQHIRRGEHEQAIAVMRKAGRANPNSAEAFLALSQIYQIVNRRPEARAAAEQAIAVEPKNYKGYIQLASLYIADQDEENAKKILRRALAKVAEQLPALRMLGDLHVQHIRAISSSTADIKEAIYFYEKAAAWPTDDLTLVYLQRLGDLYLINRQADKALACFQKIALHDPDNLQTQQKLALCYVAVGDREQALATLRTIAGQESPSSDLYYYLGELYDSLGDREHAIESYQAAREVEPANPKSYLKMAGIHLRDNPQKAREVLLEGLRRLPKERLFLEILAQIYLRNQQYQEALTLFRQMQKNLAADDPIFQDARFYMHYGIAAQQCRLADLAMLLYAKAIEIDPHSLEARLRLATLEIWRQNPEEALALMEEPLLTNPRDAAAWFFYAVINNRAERYPEAAAAFKETEALAKLFADGGTAALDAAFYFNYGAACERSGDYAKAEMLLAKAIRLDPENGEAFNYLAYMWAEKGVKLDQAREYVGQALDLEPDNGAYLDTLGWILFKEQKYEPALEYIQNACALLPDDPTVLDHLGDALARAGQAPAALEAWKKSFQFDSTNAALEKKLREHGVDLEALRRNLKPARKPPRLEE